MGWLEKRKARPDFGLTRHPGGGELGLLSESTKLGLDVDSWRFIHPGKRRWYLVQVVEDLFGDMVIVRLWGGLGSRRQGRKTELYAPDRLLALLRRRRQRGYQLAVDLPAEAGVEDAPLAGGVVPRRGGRPGKRLPEGSHQVA